MIKELKAYIKSDYDKSGRLIQLAMDRFLVDLKRKDLVFDEKVAEKFFKFANMCNMWKGTKAGEAFPWQLWQKFFLAQVFGWKWKATGLRRFRSVYMQVARKNGKTSIGAVASIFHITADNVVGGQAWIGANREEQARILVNDAGQIIKASPALRKHYDTWDYLGTIKKVAYPKKKGILSPLGRDSKTSDGFDPSLGIIDEYHEAKDDSLLNVIESGMGAREEPLMMVITTAGFSRQTPCYSNLRRTGIGILEGTLEDDSFLPLIFEMDDGDDWEDEKNWYKSNPNLGVSVFPEFLKNRFNKAKNEGGTKEVDFKTKNLNVWTDASSVWIPDRVWAKNKIEPTASEVWFMGADLGSVSDYTAVILFSLPDGRGIHSVIPFFWIPEEKISEKEGSESINIRNWIRDGYLRVTPGNTTDFAQIEEEILQIGQEYNIHAYGFDPHQAVQMMTNLASNALNVVKIPQNKSRLSEPAKTIEKLARESKLAHGDHPVLRWHVSNAVAEIDNNNNYRILKEHANNKIDGVSALMNAIAVWQQEYQEQSFIIDSW